MTRDADAKGNATLLLLRIARRAVYESRRAGGTRDGIRRTLLQYFDDVAAANPSDDWPFLRALVERAIDDELYQYQNQSEVIA